MTKFNGPHVLKLDTETSLMQFWGWRFYQDNLGPDNIKQDRTFLCAAWEWDYTHAGYPNMKGVHSCSILDNKKRFAKSVYDDYSVVRTLYGVVNDADIIITQNGDKFDLRLLNTRSLYHGLPPLKPSLSIDTLKGLKKRFGMSSNAMHYVNKYLGLAEKEKLPFEVWKSICADETPLGEKEVLLQRMVDYCENDVKALGELYSKIAPWITNHPDVMPNTTDTLICNVIGCGGRLSKEGKHRTKNGWYQSYSCVKCGHWMRGTKRLDHSEVI